MKDELFQDLLESVKQGGEIMQGVREPSRVFNYPDPDIKTMRAKQGMSQEEFAVSLGISVKTLQNWEQKRRRPKGPAMVLLQLVEKFPEILQVTQDLDGFVSLEKFEKIQNRLTKLEEENQNLRTQIPTVI